MVGGRVSDYLKICNMTTFKNPQLFLDKKSKCPNRVFIFFYNFYNFCFGGGAYSNIYANATFYNPRTTLSWRKVNSSEREKKRKTPLILATTFCQKLPRLHTHICLNQFLLMPMGSLFLSLYIQNRSFILASW